MCPLAFGRIRIRIDLEVPHLLHREWYSALLDAWIVHMVEPVYPLRALQFVEVPRISGMHESRILTEANELLRAPPPTLLEARIAYLVGVVHILKALWLVDFAVFSGYTIKSG